MIALDATLVRLVAAVVPEAVRRRALRYAGDVALRAELIEVLAALGCEALHVGELVRERNEERAAETRRYLEAVQVLQAERAGWERCIMERDAARAEAERLSAELRIARGNADTTAVSPANVACCYCGKPQDAEGGFYDGPTTPLCAACYRPVTAGGPSGMDILAKLAADRVKAAP